MFYAPFGLMVVLLRFHSHMRSMVLVLWEVGTILGNGYRIQGQNCCIASGEWNASRVSLHEFDIRYIMFKVTHVECISVV